MGDDGPDAKEVDEFFDKYEDLCRLANDGRGMNATEHLTTLLSCLRGSKEKVYKLVYRKHRKLGTVGDDPDKVFEEIKSRLMKFVETPMEKQMRLMGEWDALWKGQRTAHQFEAVFEESVTELELAGLGKNERELLLGYLQKVGPQAAAEVQKDVRAWTDAGGVITSRCVATWEEAHKVLVEIEGIRAGRRALQTTYAFTPDGGGGGGGKAGGGGTGKAKVSGGKGVCWEMRDKGTCSRGDKCGFSHDQKELAEARKRSTGGKPGATSSEKPMTPDQVAKAVEAGIAKAKGKGKKGEGGQEGSQRRKRKGCWKG